MLPVAWQPKTAFGRSAKAWWNAPATQAGAQYAAGVATQYLMNAGLAAAQSYAGTGKMDSKQIFTQAGVSTLYQQASNIRQLQGTSDVLNPVATAALLDAGAVALTTISEGGTSEEVSRKLAAQIFETATALIKQGYSPNQAAEITAAALDAAAVKLATDPTP